VIGDLICWTLKHATHDNYVQITMTQRPLVVFSVTIFTALLGNRFQRRTFSFLRVAELPSALAANSLSSLNCLPACRLSSAKNPALQVWRVSKTETIKYPHESRGTQIRERLLLRCPATTENYRRDLWSEGLPHINKRATVCK
jgi:hypothetical protein